jgi:hypothetical protein
MKALGILLVCALLIGCAQTVTEQTPELPPPPPPLVQENLPPAVEPQMGDGAGAVVTGTDKTFGDVGKVTPLEIDQVSCERDTRTIRFRFKNDDTRIWNLDNNYGWSEPGVPKEKVNVQVEVNSYQVNGQRQPVDSLTQEMLFGPNWPFSNNCGGVQLLSPGEDVTCELSPVSLKDANQLAQGYNEIFIKTPTSKHIIQFTCE